MQRYKKQDASIECEFIVPAEVCGKAVRLGLQKEQPQMQQAGKRTQLQRFESAASAFCRSLRDLKHYAHGKTQKQVLSALLVLAEDTELHNDIAGRILTGETAEAAVKTVAEQYVGIMRRAEDGQMRSGAVELESICTGFLEHMSRGCETDYAGYRDRIVVALEISAIQIMRLSMAGALGVAAERGSKTGHAAIFAKTEGMPYAIAAEGLYDEVADGDMVLFDPEKEHIVIRPPDIQASGPKKCEESQAKPKPFFAANVTGRRGALSAKKNGAWGIGLLRTEALLMQYHREPGEKEQEELYRTILQAGLPVYARLADMDEDKRLPWLMAEKEGKRLRGIDAVCENRNFYQAQIRALLGAGYLAPHGIMAPMIRCAEDFVYVKRMVAEAAQDRKIPAERLKTGCMVETPQAVEDIEEIAGLAGFLSIGTNDLTRYTLGMPREEDLSTLYPEIKKSISKVVRESHKKGVSVGICGDAAANKNNLLFFDEIGVDYVSVPPSLIAGLADLHDKNEESDFRGR